ncbi:porin [Rodentibacter pneumotropicus]|uniref:porin n=1 Tax=Rodentibacter pneumotropicus TaxID=758 RepID=UPI0003695364|nr:porin [Rodentibacter pneumotropicus]OOF63257.1 hypothetical protein BH925_08825 [Rodentibacter pneumotropicus]THA03746.1 porin [Rodentibacter pneumotropicus]THA17059.1 porin [Rodentibacter pneumotropicus]
MKKTLAALIIGAFAASAANAAVVYDNEGTKFEVNGSLRLMLEKSNQGGHWEKKDANGDVTSEGKKYSHTGLRNAGSRVEFKVKHDLSDGFYALGRAELRFDGKNENGKSAAKEDGFGSVRAHRAYVGLGKKELGQVTFGRQVTIGDDVGIAEDYDYGILPDYVPTSGRSVIRYDYYGVEGLQLGASYQFAEDRTNNEVNNGSLSNGVQAGFLYEDNGLILEGVYGRANYKSELNSNARRNVDGLMLSAGYDFKSFLVSVDTGYQKDKTDGKETKKSFFVSPGFQVPVITDVSKVYGNYLYEQTKTGNDKTKTHGFLLGVDYKLHKQVITYVEGKYVQSKDYTNGNYDENSKVKDKAIGVGLRVFF